MNAAFLQNPNLSTFYWSLVSFSPSCFQTNKMLDVKLLTNLQGLCALNLVS